MSWDYSDVYVARCGHCCSTASEGHRHERVCERCQDPTWDHELEVVDGESGDVIETMTMDHFRCHGITELGLYARRRRGK